MSFQNFRIPDSFSRGKEVKGLGSPSWEPDEMLLQNPPSKGRCVCSARLQWRPSRPIWQQDAQGKESSDRTRIFVSWVFFCHLKNYIIFRTNWVLDTDFLSCLLILFFTMPVSPFSWIAFRFAGSIRLSKWAIHFLGKIDHMAWQKLELGAATQVERNCIIGFVCKAASTKYTPSNGVPTR